MNDISIYKKYLYYLISSQRNTRNHMTNKKIYIPSPLSRCINANEIHLLYLSDSSDSFYSDSDSDSDRDSIENFIVIGEDNENDILQFDETFSF